MRNMRKRTDPDSLLTTLMLQVLIALTQGDKHGYAILREIEQRSGGRAVGAGTLYRTIRQLVDAGLITEVTSKESNHSQRRTYRITRAGRGRASAEADRLRKVVQWAKSADLVHRPS